MWPAKLCIENAEYTATLFYAGADGSEYTQDKAAGRLDRRKLTLVCKPKDQKREPRLGIVQGHVVLSLPSTTPNLTIDETRHIAEDLMAAVSNATALEEFIESRFGPASD
ncbi:MAG: hypothetical protein K2M15_03680 [Oscillospiraceae bacterium]|nr:hypothetical protein [Oscillospiraceae bacterium]MDE7172489.1 hypothetical protein [Oscillospiraceae bacterium]